MKEPAPPHLADVVCLVRADGAVGPVGLIEDRMWVPVAST
jgi:hypothetical protein